MIAGLIGRFGGAVAALIVLGAVGLVISSIAGGLAWLRADAAKDADLACEARWTDAVDQATYLEAIERAATNELMLKLSETARRDRETTISELNQTVDDYEREAALARAGSEAGTAPAAICAPTDADREWLRSLRARARR